MPCAYHLNLEEGLVTITGSEQVALSDAISLGRRLLADPEFDPCLPHLIDLRGLQVEHAAGEGRAFREFVLEDYRPRIEASIAVVIDHTLEQAAVAGLYHISCAMERTEMFDQYDHALRWLMRREFVASGAARI